MRPSSAYVVPSAAAAAAKHTPPVTVTPLKEATGSDATTATGVGTSAATPASTNVVLKISPAVLSPLETKVSDQHTAAAAAQIGSAAI